MKFMSSKEWQEIEKPATVRHMSLYSKIDSAILQLLGTIEWKPQVLSFCIPKLMMRISLFRKNST